MFVDHCQRTDLNITTQKHKNKQLFVIIEIIILESLYSRRPSFVWAAAAAEAEVPGDDDSSLQVFITRAMRILALT